jgi:uncharacterized protein (TIGR00369 family)
MNDEKVSRIPLDLFKSFVEERVPFNNFLRLQVEEMSEGRVVVRLPFREELVGDVFRPALHGGAIAAAIDATAGAAAFTNVTVKDRMSTIDLRIDYLRPAPKEDLLATGIVRRMGNRVAVVNVVVAVAGEHDKPVAEGRAVFSLVRDFVG